LNIQVINDLTSIHSKQWNALNQDNNPFLRYEFLAALEKHHCVGERHGWLPYHLVLFDEKEENKQLIAAMPLYLKYNSYGEFVFDFAWADAYQRSGLEYYPKLVASIPYTPVRSSSVLIHHSESDAKQIEIRQQFLEKALKLAETLQVSGLHILFPKQNEINSLESGKTFRRYDVQFHWTNNNYQDFDEFLNALTSSKRKKLKRDRRFVIENSVKIKIIHGHEASTKQIELAEHFYRKTFVEKYGYPTLNLDFFTDICASMGNQIVFFFAYIDDKTIACAICFKNQDTLYGRHWGCSEDIPGLHFELCYHQGIEYCIEHNLQNYEPGAQGEHKISRGFLPTQTISHHWIAHPEFSKAIINYCNMETQANLEYYQKLLLRSPYRCS